MRTLTSRWGMQLTVIPLIIAILACSTGIPIPVLAPATATPTFTPTATNTPRPTSTPTEVPPPVAIYGCLFADACPTATYIRQYFPEGTTLYNNTTYEVVVSTADEVRFSYGWCTIDSATLEKNIASMEYVFMIDEVSYLDKIDQGYTSMQDGNDPNTVYPCYSIGAVLTGWKAGENHRVVIGAKFLQEINDGWDTYSAGDYLGIYSVRPSSIPTRPPATATPKATATPTRKPTNTPAPQVYNTEVPSCAATSSITVTNDTDGWVSISFYGPANFSYGLGSGETQSFAVCPGTYDYAAFGCGGAADYGTVTDGESLSFFCTSGGG